MSKSKFKKLNLPTDAEFAVMDGLAQVGWDYGLGLVHSSEGQIKRGTVYVLLDRLIERGFVERKVIKTQKVYHLTEKGEEVWIRLHDLQQAGDI